LVHILQCSRSELLHHPTPSANQLKIYNDLVAQRCKRIPLQHVLGNTEFYGLMFKSTPAALIPRPDTESLVETVIDHLQHQVAPKILDIGTGSGIIAITLAHELPTAQVFATDISKPALALAKQNAHLNQVEDRTHFLQSNLLSSLSATSQFDVIVSNPPYIPTADISDLDTEVRDHDPLLALDGGLDGLGFYRHLIPQSLPYLKPDGLLALEIGHDQCPAIETLFSQEEAFIQTRAHQDLAGHTRILISKKQK
ncbi:MAG: peptide chain release factor N(5)-glutamine methyltransferase, partial [Candidatus Latescibacteria bacterium]|nr:peptide chain release factor N(5)-glutamine methyltransferase [Candidatus Latescibacterota bacterium]